MTPRWRAVLQVQRLLRLLLDSHVPLGIMALQVARAHGLAGEDLVKAEARDLPRLGMLGTLARELAEQLVSEEPFEPNEAWRRDVQRVIDEVVRRRDARRAAAEAAAGDRARDAEDEHKAVLLELDELLAFLALEQAGVR